MKILKKKLFFFFFLVAKCFSREFILVIEQASDGSGFVSEYEILESSLVFTGRSKEIYYAAECAISPNSEFFFVLTKPYDGSFPTKIKKIDLKSWEITTSLEVPSEFISIGGTIQVSPTSTIAAFSDQNIGLDHYIGVLDIETSGFVGFIPVPFPSRNGMYSKKGTLYGISANLDNDNNKLYWGGGDFLVHQLSLERGFLRDLTFDSKQNFCYVLSKGSGSGDLSKIIKVNLETSSLVKPFLSTDYPSLSKIKITPDDQFFILLQDDYLESKLIKLPAKDFGVSSESEKILKLVDSSDIPLKFIPTALCLSKDGKKAVIGTTFLKITSSGFEFKGLLYLIDVESWKILQQIETSHPQLAVTSYVPSIIDLQVTAKVQKERYLSYSAFEIFLEWKADQDLSEVAFYRLINNSEILKEGAEPSFSYCVSKKSGKLIYQIQGFNSENKVIAEGSCQLQF